MPLKFEIQSPKRFSGTFLKANIENALSALALTVGNQNNFGVTRQDLNFLFFYNNANYSDYVNQSMSMYTHNQRYL